MDPSYGVVAPRKEVWSFDLDKFAIHLDQVVSARASDDHTDSGKFFSRNVFTWALTDHAGMVQRRLVGRAEEGAVDTLISTNQKAGCEPLYAVTVPTNCRTPGIIMK